MLAPSVSSGVFLRSTAVLFFLSAVLIESCSGQAYNDATQLFEDKLGNKSYYNNKVRPLLDQSQTLFVTFEFYIAAITEMDDKTQKFVTNGFLGLNWIDQLASWDPASYNNVTTIHPDPLDIWRPRMVLQNTMGDRDLFEDDYSPLVVSSDGLVRWYPGSLFPTSCKLNMKKYPFDVQTCQIRMFSILWTTQEMWFIPRPYVEPVGEVDFTWYTESGEWKMSSTHVSSIADSSGVSLIIIEFHLERRPAFFVINIILPIVLMSFLNIMVFLIPVDSGEKISYSITVLLALAVFVSIISDMLPRSSDTLPIVSLYLMTLFMLSVGCVVVTIVTVWLHSRNERKTKHQQAKQSFKSIFKKVTTFNRATAPLTTNVVPIRNDEVKMPLEDLEANPIPSFLDTLRNMRKGENTTGSPREEDKKRLTIGLPGEKCTAPPVNRYKQMSKHINEVSFVTFFVIWCLVTLIFMAVIAS